MWGEKKERNAQGGLKIGPSHSRLLTPPSLRNRLAHCGHSLTPACLGPCCQELPEAVSPASGHSPGLALKARHNHSQAVQCFTVTHPETGKNGGDHDGPADKPARPGRTQPTCSLPLPYTFLDFWFMPALYVPCTRQL